MKKSSKSKIKKSANGSQKISHFFKKISNVALSTDTEIVAVDDSEDDTPADNKRKRPNDNTTSPKPLESITNLPRCSMSPDFVCETPQQKPKRLREQNLSPDIIPCTLNVKDLPKLGESLRHGKGKITLKSREKLFDDYNKTPQKQQVVKTSKSSEKKSPLKLFNKSPKSLDKFNVEIIDNFIKVTPTKSNNCEISPVRSPFVLEIQCTNETTPTKSSPKKEFCSSSKAKVKLDFNSIYGDIMHDDVWKEEFLEKVESVHTLDLIKFHHCRIVDIIREPLSVTLILKSTKNNQTAMCDVEGFWTNLKLEKNDLVYVSAGYSNDRLKWVVNNERGLITHHPDVLISATSVVGAQFCLRRSILKEKYQGFEPTNQVMIVGILVHKLLQEVLRRKIHAFSEIEVAAKKMMLEKDTIWMCYESDLSIDSILRELMVFVPRIESFVNHYVLRKKGATFSESKIDQIQDIEENIWCHELGVKGKVDVSVQSDWNMLPLEVKTGRASFSLEHRGQVMFYIMMMQKLGFQVSSGLLLYLREGVLREVPITEKEKRDLIILRNEVAYFLTRHPKFSDESVEWELPDPINHHSACSQCPYNTICCVYLKYHKTELGNNSLNTLQNEILSHLKPIHIDYFIKWSGLLLLEASEKKGQCIINVVVKDVTEYGGLYEHSFIKVSDATNFNMQSCGIGLGNYLVVSTDGRPAVAAGFVTFIDAEMIMINLDRNLKQKYSNQAFHLDAYSSSMSQGFNMTNLSLLLEASEQASRLRKFIIEKELPTFENKLPKLVATKGTAILRKLNKMQQKAVLKSLSTNDYLLIKGMPGTGKTDTIVSLIELLVELKKSVLITSHTHSAVDNVCVRLVARGVSLLRLGSDSKIHPNLRMYSETTLTKHCRTPEQFEKVYNSAQVLAVTCLGSGHSVLNKRMMDVCVVDESSQVLQCSVFRALSSARKFILIGDSDQLPPIVRNVEALAKGLSESLFERLDNPNATVILRLNYRMNQPITDMANNLTYNGQLLTANDIVANATLDVPDYDGMIKLYENQLWVLNTLDRSLSASVRILDTGPISYQHRKDVLQESEEVKCTNPFEVGVIVKLINALLAAGISNEAIGVIAPYRAQVSQLTLSLKEKNIETSTVDQFQGRDKDVILYSCTRSGQRTVAASESQTEILDDKRRLTVAVTRAKHKFILVGDVSTMRQYSPFRKLLDSLAEDCFIRLNDGELGFSWADVM
ncbi:hypothetical protein FQR65_LT01574 [Abscondita terminalis]|nr:hypothetical protein FQR65_LT01574 [Abscondita terminalis]